MAITRAQQAKQMLQNGGMLVQPGFGGTRQGYRGDDAAKAERARSPSGKNTSRADERGSVERDTGLERASCLLYTSPSPRDGLLSRMPSSA